MRSNEANKSNDTTVTKQSSAWQLRNHTNQEYLHIVLKIVLPCEHFHKHPFYVYNIISKD